MFEAGGQVQFMTAGGMLDIVGEKVRKKDACPTVHEREMAIE